MGLKDHAEEEKKIAHKVKRAPRAWEARREALIGHIILVEHSMDTVFARTSACTHNQDSVHFSIYIFYARCRTLFYPPRFPRLVRARVYLLPYSSLQSWFFFFFIMTAITVHSDHFFRLSCHLSIGMDKYTRLHQVPTSNIIIFLDFVLIFYACTRPVFIEFLPASLMTFSNVVCARVSVCRLGSFFCVVNYNSKWIITVLRCSVRPSLKPHYK